MLTYGFYNSIDHDRKYNASDFSGMFDGVIKDGVFATYGDGLHVSAASGMNVNIGIGRAWFNHTWTYNDTILPVSGFEAELTFDRIDAVVLEVNRTTSVRANSIKMVKGPVGNSSARPNMTHTDTVDQYALAYILIPAGSTEITQGNITNVIGSEETPFVTGVLETIEADLLFAQWQGQFEEWISAKKEEIESWEADEKQAFLDWVDAFHTEFDSWETGAKASFDTWFANLQYVLDGDVAGKLQNEIDGQTVHTWPSGRSYKPLNDNFVDASGVVVTNNGKTLAQAIKDGSIGGGGGREKTWEEFLELPEEEQKSGLYFIPDGANEDGYDAEFVRYREGNVRQALDGLNSNLIVLEGRVEDLEEKSSTNETVLLGFGTNQNTTLQLNDSMRNYKSIIVAFVGGIVLPAWLTINTFPTDLILDSNIVNEILVSRNDTLYVSIKNITDTSVYVNYLPSSRGVAIFGVK